MDQIAFADEETVDDVGEIPCDLRHPQPIG